MSTINTLTIGTGKDYETLSAFVADTGIVTDLVASGITYNLECYSGSNLGGANFYGFTTDSDNYIKIVAASGEQFTDAYNDGAYIQSDVTDPEFNTGGVHIVFENMRLITALGWSEYDTDNVTLKNCYVLFDTAGSTIMGNFIHSTEYNGQIVNTIIDASDVGIASGCVLNLGASTPRDSIINVSIFGGPAGWGINADENIKIYNTVVVQKSDVSLEAGFVPYNLDGTIITNCVTSKSSFTNGTDVPVDTNCYTGISYEDNFDGYKPKGNSILRKNGIINNFASDDIFSKQRIYVDIGAIQTNIVETYDIASLWTDLKLFISAYRKYTLDCPAIINALTASKLSAITSDVDRILLLASMIQNDDDNKGSLSDMGDEEVKNCETYITGYMRKKMYSVSTSQTDILKDFDYWHGINEQKIKGVDLKYSVKNIATGDGSLGSIVIPQMVKPQVVELLCTSTTTVGSETWSVTGSVTGSIGTAYTNQTFLNADTGLSFKVSLKSAVNWALGDKIQIHLITETTAINQEFFRDEFGFVFSNNVIDGTETIND